MTQVTGCPAGYNVGLPADTLACLKRKYELLQSCVDGHETQSSTSESTPVNSATRGVGAVIKFAMRMHAICY